MILTHRKIPKELLYFQALQYRYNLDNTSEKKWRALEKGYTGELLYDAIFDDIVSHLYVFRDIYLNVENSTLQCDALIVHDEGFIVNEIKNFRGIYTYENEKWYVRQNEISEDPISQLKRTTNKLIKFKYLYNKNFNTERKVVFPNPDFSVESAHPSANNYLVVRHHLRRYLNGMNELTSTHRADDLVKIIQNHIVEDPYFNYTTNFNDLKKGVYCRVCGSFNLEKRSFHFKCSDCEHTDTIHTIIVQALADYNILFHNDYLTRQKLWELLGGRVGHSTLNTYLLKYCHKYDKGPSSKYKFRFYDFEDATNNEMRLWRYKDMPIRNIYSGSLN